MTTPELSGTDVVEAWADLDDATRALVVSVFGRAPGPDMTPADDERLASIIAAINAPETVAEAQAPTLPDLPPPDVDPLRARIRAMDDATRELFLQRWTASGLPGLADAAGVSVVLPAETHHAIEQLIADHEPPAPDGLHASLMSRLADLPNGPRITAENRLRAQSGGRLGVAIDCTVGRAATFAAILDAVEAEAEEVVAAALGPVAEPVGEVITTPVADAAALADALPAKAKVAEVIAWVGADPQRAQFALNAERARSKPRDGVVNKLAPLVGGSEALPPASPPATAEEVSAPAEPAAAPHPSAPLEGEQEGQPAEGEQLTIEQACAEQVPLDAAKVRGLVARLREAADLLEAAAADGVVRIGRQA